MQLHNVLRTFYGSTFPLLKGVTDPLRPCGPSLRPPQGPDVRLSKMSTLRRGDAAARAVIGPLTQTRRRTEASFYVVLALRVVGTQSALKSKLCSKDAF